MTLLIMSLLFSGYAYPVKHEVRFSNRGFVNERKFVLKQVTDESEDKEFLPPLENITIDWVDLNHDGTLDFITFIEDSAYCGSAGCNTRFFLVKPNQKPKLILELTTRGGIFILKNKTKGFHDLAFVGEHHVYGEDPDTNNKASIWRWNGKIYDLVRRNVVWEKK